MRLLSCLIMILAMLSMTLHVASANASREGRAPIMIVHADHDYAAAPRHHHAGKSVDANHDCPPGDHHKRGDCCDTPCCSSPCVGPVVGLGAFEPAYRFAVVPAPNPDLLPDGILDGRLIRPPIFG